MNMSSPTPNPSIERTASLLEAVRACRTLSDRIFRAILRHEWPLRVEKRDAL